MPIQSGKATCELKSPLIFDVIISLPISSPAVAIQNTWGGGDDDVGLLSYFAPTIHHLENKNVKIKNVKIY